MSINFEELLNYLHKDVGPTLENSVHDHTSKHAIDRINSIYPLKNKCVLDIGCGIGRDMFYMESLGAKCWGVTINEKEFIKIEHPRIYLCDMHDLSLFGGMDLIFASHVLEHSPCPLLVLKQFYTALQPYGKVYIEVPSPKPWSIHNQNHYSIFCKDMWLELFSKARFKCEEQINLKVNIAEKEGENPYIEDEFWGFILKKNEL